MLERRQLGERIAARRDHLNLTQQQLAQHLGIDRPRLSGIERGTRPLDAAILSKLTRILGVTAGSLLGLEEPTAKPPAADAQPVLRFRAQLASESSAVELADFLTFIERYRKLAAWADSRPPRPDLPHLSYASDLRHYASEADAKRVRDAWGLADVPIGLEIFDVLEQRGVSAYRDATTSTDVSGAYYRDDDVGPILFVNAREWPYRQVFTAAHELAHLIYDHRSGFSRNLDQTNEERMCNRFASAFLMPQSAVETELARRDTRFERIEAEDVLSLHRTFGVSYGAMLVRLKTLGILKGNRYDELKTVHPVREAINRGYLVEPWEYGYQAEEVTPQERMTWLPRRFLRLVRKAVNAGHLSDRKAAQHVNLDYEEWLSLDRPVDGQPANDNDDERQRDEDLKANEFLVAS